MLLGGGASMVYHLMSDDDVERIMRHPQVAIASDSGVLTFGDGVPHPRGYGNNARVLGEYVRARHVITLEEAVRKMTSLPAAHFRVAGRGLIKEGYAADLVVFDAATVATPRPSRSRTPMRRASPTSSSMAWSSSERYADGCPPRAGDCEFATREALTPYAVFESALRRRRTVT